MNKQINIRRAIGFLEKLLDAAKRRELSRAIVLSRRYSRFIFDKSNYDSLYLCDLDNCRQSCILAFLLPKDYDACISDAEKRLAKIKKKYAR